MSSDYATRAAIAIDGTALDGSLVSLVERVLVDDHLHLPDMFTVTLRDPDRDVAERAKVRIGSTIGISGVAVGQRSESLLVSGEVTSLEGEYGPDGARFIIRGFDKSHRMVGGVRTETYRDVTDSDVVRTIAGRTGVEVGQVDESGVTHQHLSQANLSDWDFLMSRAREVGFDVAVSDGKLCFRRPPAASTAPGSGDYDSTDPLQLVLGGNLLEFYPRITALGQVREVEVRGWDPAQKQAIVGTAAAATSSVSVTETPAHLAEVSGRERWVGINRPLAQQSAADVAATAEAERIASSFLEAEGIARGHPGLKAGATVSVTGVAEPFEGRYTLTHTRHVFDDEGYRTHLSVSGRHDRSLLGLTGSGSGDASSAASGGHIAGLLVALVTDNADPQALGRVKLKFPTLSDAYESDWARLAQPGAGPDSGMTMLPEVNDEVLVGFESGDIRRPYVIGGLWNGQDKPRLGDGLFDNGAVTRRGIISRVGHRIVFMDGAAKSGVCLVSGDDSLRLALKQSDSSLELHSDGTITVRSARVMRLESDARPLHQGGRLSDTGGPGAGRHQEQYRRGCRRPAHRAELRTRAMGSPAIVLGDRISGICPVHQIPNPATGVPQPAPPMPFSAPLVSGLESSVLISGKPGAVLGSSGLNAPPHVGLHPADPFMVPGMQEGRIVTGSATVMFGGKPAANATSSAMCCATPGSPIPSVANVLIG